MREVSEGVWSVTAGFFPSNSYICRADTAGAAFLIDAGLDPVVIDGAFEQLKLKPAQIFCTHGHFDHIGGAAFFQRKYGAKVYLHTDDLKTAKANNFLLMLKKVTARIELPALELIGDGFSMPFGNASLTYQHTPGHTPGSCVIRWRDELFSGDTLYSRSLGLANTAGEKPEQLRQSVLGLWSDLDDVVVHPGHGPSAPGATIKANNHALRAFLGVDQPPAVEGQARHA